MTLLFIYMSIALAFSFLCSIAEAVLLSVTPSYIALQERGHRHSGDLLRGLKDDINKPLAAILTLNTIAHTVGAAGVGAQATEVFGSGYLGITSAVLTFLILVFSEIIPKTLGAYYWRKLAPLTAYCLRMLVIVMYPFVKLSEIVTRSLGEATAVKGFSRGEFLAMAELSQEEGQLDQQETEILKNLLEMDRVRVKDVMTPQNVVFSVPENLSVGAYFSKYQGERFSRIPTFQEAPDQLTGFVLLNDLLLAQARGNSGNRMSVYRRELHAVIEQMSLAHVIREMLDKRAHMMLVVDEYGGTEGIVTLEDIIESLLGLEIVDEGDKTTDMRKLARKLWRRRAQDQMLEVDDAQAREKE